MGAGGAGAAECDGTGAGGGGGGGGFYGGGGGGSGGRAAGGGGAGSSYIDPSLASGNVESGAGDEQEITITNAAPVSACTGIHGYGRVGSVAKEGAIVQDSLSTSKGAKEVFEAGIQKPTLGELRLTALTGSACTAIKGGREFSGYGPATLKGVAGYQVAFSFAVQGSPSPSALR